MNTTIQSFQRIATDTTFRDTDRVKVEGGDVHKANSSSFGRFFAMLTGARQRENRAAYDAFAGALRDKYGEMGVNVLKNHRAEATKTQKLTKADISTVLKQAAAFHEAQQRSSEAAAKAKEAASVAPLTIEDINFSVEDVKESATQALKENLNQFRTIQCFGKTVAGGASPGAAKNLSNNQKPEDIFKSMYDARFETMISLDQDTSGIGKGLFDAKKSNNDFSINHFNEPEHQIPRNGEPSVNQMQNLVRLAKQSTVDIFIHCDDGKGRTGTVMAGLKIADYVEKETKKGNIGNLSRQLNMPPVDVELQNPEPGKTTGKALPLVAHMVKELRTSAGKESFEPISGSVQTSGQLEFLNTFFAQCVQDAMKQTGYVKGGTFNA